jgi:TetR/AcrR family transcriptional repressor of nem operon
MQHLLLEAVMGRSSRQQADENRERIVKVASGLFAAHGVGAVGIADVMKAAGMTQGGFYKHFESKDVLAAEACGFAFSGANRMWRHVAQVAQHAGRDVASAIITYYLDPKPPEMTCPMVAYAPDAASGSEDSPLIAAYGAGVRGLCETFCELSVSGSPDMSEDRARIQFAAMVGSNMLTRPSRGNTWLGKFRQSMKSTLTPGGAGRKSKTTR